MVFSYLSILFVVCGGYVMDNAYKVIDIPNIAYNAEGKKYALNTIKQNYQERVNEFKDYIDSLVSFQSSEIDGDRITSIFFPDGNNDFFISHSHIDVKIALHLNVIAKKYNYSAFVDSAIWFNVNEIINNLLLAYNSSSKDFLLHLASNAYIMLASSLIKAINKSRIFLFLATPNSLETRLNREYLTYSPWIKLELETSSLILENKRQSVFVEGSESFPGFYYAAEIQHLNSISFQDLLNKIANRTI